MGTALMILAALGGVVCTIGVGLAKDELSAWMPKIILFFLNKIVRRLPSNIRERYSEEWRAHLLEYPGNLSKLYQLSGFFLASFEFSSLRKSTKMMLWFGFTYNCLFMAVLWIDALLGTEYLAPPQTVDDITLYGISLNIAFIFGCTLSMFLFAKVMAFTLVRPVVWVLGRLRRS